MSWIRVALAICVVMLAAPSASAQSGGILVLVLDGDGQPLPGATVTISHETGFVKTTAQMTDQEGLVRFPVLRPGSGYSVHVAFPGYSPVRHEGLRVRSSDTVRLSIEMIAALQEQVVVTAERDVIDLDTSQTATKFSADFIGDLPVPGRFYQNVLTLAPGVQDADGDGNPNVHGSRERDFAAMVSGVRNVDPLTGQWMSRVNPNSIEELEVITAGAGVEFGRAQGGYARIIQKQGNNEHEGLAELYYRSNILDGTGAASNSALDDVSEPEFTWLQPAVQLSGPVFRDKLWYRLSHEYRKIDEPLNTAGSIEVSELTEWTHSDQLTWQVSPRNKLAFQYQADPSLRTKYGVSSVLPGESAQDRERNGTSYSVTWTAPYSPRILIESLAAYQDLNFSLRPTSTGVPNDCVTGNAFLELSQCRDLESGQISGSHYRTQDDHSQRFTMNAKATLYGKFLGLSHQFKMGFGVENERYFRELTQGSYGVSFINPLLDPEDPQPGLGILQEYQVRTAVPESDSARATGTNWGLYAEDQFRPASNVTITVGLRIDREEINSEGRSQFDSIDELQQYEDYLEPLVWIHLISADPPSPETYQAAASGASGFPSIFTGFENFPTFTRQMQEIICREATDVGQCETFVQRDFVNQKQLELFNLRKAEDVTLSNTNFSPFLAVAWSPGSDGKTAFKASAGRHYNTIPLIVPLQELEPVLTELNYVEVSRDGPFRLQEGIQPALTAQTVDRDLDTPYQDEFTLKIEREIWTETSIALTYINRQFRDQIQDINTNVNVGDYGRCYISGFGSGVTPSPGLGEVTDPMTGERYPDTDPGDGDGRDDDCTGGSSGSGFGFSVGRPDGIPDLYLQNPFWGDIFLITNANEIDYQAFVLELMRRQYRNWELQASYTWSEARGDGEDFFQELGNDPSLRGNIQGYQSYDQRHVVKLNATTITPWGIRLGTAVTWQSGVPYSILWERYSTDNLPPASGPAYPRGWLIGTSLASATGRTRQTFPTGERNDQRNPAYWNVDLRATKEFRMGRSVNAQVSAEVFNLLNDGTYMVYNSFSKSGQQINEVNEATNRFGRRWQIGFKLNW